MSEQKKQPGVGEEALGSFGTQVGSEAGKQAGQAVGMEVAGPPGAIIGGKVGKDVGAKVGKKIGSKVGEKMDQQADEKSMPEGAAQKEDVASAKEAMPMTPPLPFNADPKSALKAVNMEKLPQPGGDAAKEAPELGDVADVSNIANSL